MSHVVARVPTAVLVLGLSIAAMCGTAAAQSSDELIRNVMGAAEPAEDPLCLETFDSGCVNVCVSGGSRSTFSMTLCPDVDD